MTEGSLVKKDRKIKPTRIRATALKSFVQEIMASCGVDADQIHTVSENLVWNDLAGRANHGVNRLSIMMKRVRRKVIDCPCKAQFSSLSENVVRLDAGNGFGQHAGFLGIQKAIELARDRGVGVVGVCNSNFFGSGAYFVHEAAKAGMASLALSNSFPKVAAHGGRKRVLGTNPLAFGAPRRNGRSLLVDMSTGASAGSTVRDFARRGAALPEGLIVDETGAALTDSKKAMSGAMLPAGGAKGYGLSLMVEVLSGVITGAGFSHQVASMYENFESGGNNGQFFLALDIRRWMPLETYYQRCESLIATVLASGDEGEVRIPGEGRWACFEDNVAHGVPFEADMLKALEALAAECGVKTPWGDKEGAA